MSPSSRQKIDAVFDALDADLDRACELSFDALSTSEQLALLERCERVRRRIPAVEHRLINSVARQATAEELGGKVSHAIAEWTLISRAEASRRIREAADLGPRRGLTGEPLAPMLAGTAARQREGKLGAGQVAVIRERGAVSSATTAEATNRLPAKLVLSSWLVQPQGAVADLAAGAGNGAFH